ncbi:MAG: ABC transporter permease [Bdellovibrionaceae bacterium]|nr:ABC transporter permease [Pseudobdellovibrionaceae bacterium]
MIAHVIAIRNLIKNRYRTVVSLGMIIGALIAITIFRGYVLRTLEIVQTTIVNGQFGHLQVAKELYWTQEYKNKKETLLTDYLPIVEEISAIPQVRAVSPRSKFYGLLSTEKLSDSAMIIGIDPKQEPDFEVGLALIEGHKFDVSNRGIMIGTSLARRLRVKVNDDITLVASTLDLVINAMDFRVAGVFATGTEEFDSVAAFIDIKEAQKVMNTSSVDVLKISLKSAKDVDAVKGAIESKLSGKNVLVKTWYDISTLFRKVESFYNTQTGLMFGILIFIVLLGISNTVSMSLNERIGEIGTLRALGQSQMSLLKQFMLESFYLCTMAIVIGVALAKLLITMINSAKVTADIPGASLPILIEVGFYWDVILWVSLSLCLIVNIFTAILILKYVRIRIVEALRHNI